MTHETLTEFTDRLAAHRPVPGGGAVGAVQAALAAGLVAMVARYTSGEQYAEVADEATEIAAQADLLRRDALALAAADEAAFDAVSQAYALPRDSSDRAPGIQKALLQAARPPAGVVTTAEKLLPLAERLLTIGKATLVSDVGGAADCLRAALSIGRLNVEINLASLRNDADRRPVRRAIDGVDALLARADDVSEETRRRVTSKAGRS